MQQIAEVAKEILWRDIRNRWLLSGPALLTIFLAAAGPLLIVLMYSLMVKGDYGDVKYWQFSTDGWMSVLFERDPIDDTLGLSDANLAIFWRSVSLSLVTTVLTLLLGFPTAYFIATRSERSRDIWLFLITIPFWTNLLIRTFAIQELIRNEGLINTALLKFGLISKPLQMLVTGLRVVGRLDFCLFPLVGVSRLREPREAELQVGGGGLRSLCDPPQ